MKGGKEILPDWWEVDYYIVIFMIYDEDKIQDLVYAILPRGTRLL